MEIVALLADRLPEASGGELSAAAGEAEQVILNYCGLEALPGPLLHVCLNMAEDILRIRRGGEGGALKALSEGDIRVEYYEGQVPLWMEYRQQMQPFRRLRR